MPKPTEEYARRLVEETLGVATISATRFLTGYCHYVYKVGLIDGRKLVIRMASPESRHEMLGGLYWRNKLDPLGIPMPKILRADKESAFAFMLLECLPGCDLGCVYSELSEVQKRALAGAIVDAQARCAALPQAEGYGYALSYQDPALRQNQSWEDALIEELERARERIVSVGEVDVDAVDRVKSRLPEFSGYLSKVEPIAFMDDTTTRNVLVHEGKLSGIVDVDTLCFGDPLLTVGLTRLALKTMRCDTTYIDYWLEAMAATEEQRAVVDLYTAIFCVNFLGEQGQSFNRDEANVDLSMVAFLEAELSDLLSRL